MVLISSVGVVSFAAAANVTSVNLQLEYGVVTYVYFETTSGPGGSKPSTNTALTPSSSSGSYQVSAKSSAHLWSPQFGGGATIDSGTWTLNLWASGATSGTMTVSIYITAFNGKIQQTIANNVATTNIGTSKTEVVATFSGYQVSIPNNGYIGVALTAPAGGPSSFTIYWGSGQQTNFQVPYRVVS